METRLPCGDQWKAEKLGVFLALTNNKSDRDGLNIDHSVNLLLNDEHWQALYYFYFNIILIPWGEKVIFRGGGGGRISATFIESPVRLKFLIMKTVLCALLNCLYTLVCYFNIVYVYVLVGMCTPTSS